MQGYFVTQKSTLTFATQKFRNCSSTGFDNWVKCDPWLSRGWFERPMHLRKVLLLTRGNCNANSGNVYKTFRPHNYGKNTEL